MIFALNWPHANIDLVHYFLFLSFFLTVLFFHSVPEFFSIMTSFVTVIILLTSTNFNWHRGVIMEPQVFVSCQEPTTVIIL